MAGSPRDDPSIRDYEGMIVPIHDGMTFFEIF